MLSQYRPSNKGSSAFSTLSKNALQNVVQFFRPWGRDFIVLRSINKRMAAAYGDHIKRVVKTADYFKTVKANVLDQNKEHLKSLFEYAYSGSFANKADKEERAFMDDDAEKFVHNLVASPFEYAVKEMKGLASIT